MQHKIAHWFADPNSIQHALVIFALIFTECCLQLAVLAFAAWMARDLIKYIHGKHWTQKKGA